MLVGDSKYHGELVEVFTSWFGQNFYKNKIKLGVLYVII